jgi:predicted metal-dependent phosphoesterase TrpH
MKTNKSIIRDFHLHSIYSDGLFTPTRLLDEAARLKVRQIAITDHNTVAGLPEALQVSQQSDLQLITGIEVTAHLHGKEVHILGYAFQLEKLTKSTLSTYLSQIKTTDDQWARKVARLSQEQPILVQCNGTPRPLSISLHELERFQDSTKSSYFHFGVLLYDKLQRISEELATVPPRHLYYFLFRRKEPEYLEQYAALFAKYGIENQRYWYVPREEVTILPAEDVISRLCEIGAVPVIAHPGEMQLSRHDLRFLRDRGLRGVEVFTPKHSQQQIGEYEAMASDLQLFCTSGTDYHDPDHRNRVEIGRDRQGNPFRQGVTGEDLGEWSGRLANEIN